MVQDAVLRQASSQTQILDARLPRSSRQLPSPYLSALDKDEQATARLFIRKAAQATDESLQHTCLGQGPGVAGPTVASLGHPGSASQDDE